MLHLRKVIQKISKKDSKEFVFWLKQNDAGKYAQLFVLMHENKLSESEIAEELNAIPATFYSLKSRLHNKIQEFFAHNIPDSNIDLLRNVANIPNLLVNSPRETANSHLLKMEKELIEHDMPYALTTVYGALKKLNRYSQKYFEYTQLYNKHLAYTMAIDKAKELLSDFNKTLGEYLMSRNEELFELLIIIRHEMRNYAKLYESHRLQVFQNILDVEFSLFLPDRKIEPVVEVGEILAQTEKIIKTYKQDGEYSCMQTLINYLWFQYYHQQELPAKALGYYDLVNEKLSGLLLNNFCCFPSVFLLSKAEIYLINKEEQKLHTECKTIAESFNPDLEDAPNYINHIKFQAISAFYAKKYNESVSLLNKLLNTISFRNFPHADIELKLFLALCYLLVNNLELSNYLIKNVQRKLRISKSDNPLENRKESQYKNALAFAKILATSVDFPAKERDKKMRRLRDKFIQLNRGQTKMLQYIRLDDAFLKGILKIAP